MALTASAAWSLPDIERKIDLSGPTWGDSRSGQYLAGMQAQRLNDPATAARYLERALGHDPNNMALVRHVFFLMISEGMFDSARQHARMILQQDPLSLLPVTMLGVTAMRDGAYEEALTRFGVLSAAGHNGIIRALGQTWAAVGAGDLPAARAALAFPLSVPGWEGMRPIQAALIEDVGGGDPAPAYAALQADADRLPRRLRSLIENFEARQADPSVLPAVATARGGLAQAFSTISRPCCRRTSTVRR